MSTRVRRPTVASIPRAPLGVIVLLVFFGGSIFVLSGGWQSLTAPGGQTVSAVFADSGRLAPGMPVRMHGVDVGAVTATTAEPGATRTVVQMTVSDPAALPLYRNATAQLRWRTALGASYTVDLSRGTPSSGVLDPLQIDERHTSGQVELDQVLSALQAGARTGLRTTISELAKTFSPPQTLPSALGAVSAAAPSLTRGLSAVQGQAPGDLSSLIRDAGNTVHALDAPAPTLRDVVEGGGATLGTTASDVQAIEATLRLGAASLPQVSQTLGDLDHTLGLADPLISRLIPVTPQVVPTVQQLIPALSATSGLLQKARPLLASLRPAAGALAAAARQGRPLLAQLTPSLGQVADQILPDLANVDAVSKRPTYEMIGPTIADLDSAGGTLDGVSHMATLTPGASQRALDTLPCKTYLLDPSPAQLVACQSIGQVLGQILGYRPFPSGSKQ